VNRRRDITQIIIDLMDPDDREDLDQALRTWYRNIRAGGGFRLTDIGHQALQRAGIQSWRLDIKFRDITRAGILALDRQMKWPYYIDTRNRRLIMFGSSEAMMLTLYGDVNRYLGIPARDPAHQKS